MIGSWAWTWSLINSLSWKPGKFSSKHLLSPFKVSAGMKSELDKQMLRKLSRFMKRIGGKWIDGSKPMHKQVDGDKFICLDEIVKPGNACLIYSFGISNDWTFEDQMDSFGREESDKEELFENIEGCDVYAYDHTINAPPTRGRNIRYFKTGVGKGSINLKTLKALIQQNGHTGSLIQYLKVIRVGE